MVIKMKLEKYRILTKRHLILIMALLLLAGALVVVIAAVIPYAYANVTASADKPTPIRCTDRSDRVVSLTFDVRQGEVGSVREILQKYRVEATFFVTGEWAERNPEALAALSEAGQEIGNGSDTYPHMEELSRSAVIRQVTAAGDKIESATGVRPVLFRAPYDAYSRPLMESLASLGMKGIEWDVDSFDDREITADALSKRVVSGVGSGSIVRFHSDGENTCGALPSIIEQLQAQGYRFLPVSEMIYEDRYTLNREGRQIAA